MMLPWTLVSQKSAMVEGSDDTPHGVFDNCVWTNNLRKPILAATARKQEADFISVACLKHLIKCRTS